MQTITLALFAILAAAVTVPAAAQVPPPLHANAALPNPAPTAPAADWVDAPGRAIVHVDAPGATLRGWSFAGANANEKRTVVYFYGNGGLAERAEPLVRELAALGPTVTTYDYRGYGFSTGEADLLEMRQDGLREFDAAARAAGGPTHVVVMGFSLGTAIASYVASRRTLAGLILIAPIANAKEEYAYYAIHQNGLSPATAASLTLAPDAHEVFDETELVAKSSAPLLIVHGDADDVVSYPQGNEVLAASAAIDKRLVTLAGVNHTDAPRNTHTIEAIGMFLYRLR